MKYADRKPHGLALMIVLTVVAIATLLGLAVLSTATLQAQITDASKDAAVADYLAESAVQTAAYYLQRDLVNCPSSWTTTPGYKLYATGVTISDIDGSFDLDATSTGVTDEYQIHAVGRSSGAGPVTRTATSKINIVRTTPSYAVGFGGAAITIGARNYINGAPVVYGASLSNLGVLNGGSRQITSTDFAVPSSVAGQFNYYGGSVANGTYTLPNGNVGTPQILSSATIASPASLTALATNPGRVFYSSGSIVVTGAGSYNATLIARGMIDLRPPLASSITFNRQAGFPALMSDGTLAVNFKSGTVTINGVVLAGTGTSWGALTSTGTNVRINGALLTPASALATAVGTLTVNYTPANVDVQNLTPNIVQPAAGIKLSGWSQ